MISGLKHALQPAVTDLSIKFDVPSNFKVYQAPEEVPALYSGDKVVIYGIITKQKSAPDKCLKAGVNGTATLTGQILGKPVEFKLTFEIPPPSDFQSSVGMSIVHQLASKALIHELENGESWTDAATYKQRKKDIVNLSIESGVVSSYTSYMALDEGHDKLIEGALKTWDIVATMTQYREIMSPPKIGIHHSLRSAFRFGQSMHKSLASNRSRHSRRSFSYVKCSKPATHSRVTSQSEGQASMGLWDTAAAGDSEIIMEASCQKQTSTSRSKDDLKFLIYLQKAEGFWDFVIFFQCQWLQFLMPLIRDDIREICATVCVLAYMEIKFPNQRNEWELVARKAEAWLAHQTLPGLIDLEELKKEAGDYIVNNLVE